MASVRACILSIISSAVTRCTSASAHALSPRRHDSSRRPRPCRPPLLEGRGRRLRGGPGVRDGGEGEGETGDVAAVCLQAGGGWVGGSWRKGREAPAYPRTHRRRMGRSSGWHTGGGGSSRASGTEHCRSMAGRQAGRASRRPPVSTGQKHGDRYLQGGREGCQWTPHSPRVGLPDLVGHADGPLPLSEGDGLGVGPVALLEPA